VSNARSAFSRLRRTAFSRLRRTAFSRLRRTAFSRLRLATSQLSPRLLACSKLVNPKQGQWGHILGSRRHKGFSNRGKKESPFLFPGLFVVFTNGVTFVPAMPAMPTASPNHRLERPNHRRRRRQSTRARIGRRLF
jgi:hypothetical protein